jgi:D-serine deaminase-like pyridoxal phosphate-dependent protein
MDIQTPSVIIDKKVLIQNIEKMQNTANRKKINLRPHIKTHKSVEIAKLQIQHGAVGITCAKPQEGSFFETKKKLMFF